MSLHTTVTVATPGSVVVPHLVPLRCTPTMPTHIPMSEMCGWVPHWLPYHLQGPWEDVGLKDSGRHWLDTVAR